MTAGVAALAAEEALAAWWLEGRRYVEADHWMKTVEVYRSDGCSLTDCIFQKM